MEISKQDAYQIFLSEYNAIYPYANGNGIDVACGDKVFPNSVGIDIVPKDKNIKPCDLPSAAHFVFDVSDLPFKNDALDFVVSIHSIEHFANTEKILAEWLRVLKPEGYLCLIIPDSRYIPGPEDIEYYDYTHLKNFVPEEFKKIIDSITGVEIIEFDSLDNGWSFDCILQKKAKEIDRYIVAEIANEIEEKVTQALEEELNKEENV